MLGLRPEEVPYTVGLSLVAPTDEAQTRVHDSLKAEQAGQEKPFIELELRRKDDGRPVWVQRFSRPEPDGKHTRTMIIDITERVLAERERTRMAQHNAYLREELASEHNFDEIIGGATGLKDALDKVRQVAPTDATVLLLGETGTGKELVAEAIHRYSERAAKPFVALDCGAIPEALLESELFGHERGAFTGAERKRRGRFQVAEGGTLFLDEIGNLPAALQAKLLRALESRLVQPLGATQAAETDVRFVAATNEDLPHRVERGLFRGDLYFRLAQYTIRLPPLRERPSDIAFLARRFVEEASVELRRPVRDLHPDAIAALERQAWPGNVRELRNVVRQAVLAATGLEITTRELAIQTPSSSSTLDDLTRAPEPERGDRGSSLKEIAAAAARVAERDAIVDALRASAGNKSRAAKALRTDYKTLHLKMKALGIRGRDGQR
jgi:transcriptional regulator with GAF, ATPase, and Fis domain